MSDSDQNLIIYQYQPEGEQHICEAIALGRENCVTVKAYIQTCCVMLPRLYCGCEVELCVNGTSCSLSLSLSPLLCDAV